VNYSVADPFTIADLGECGSYCPEKNGTRRGLRGNIRKMKVELSSEDYTAIRCYAKTKLSEQLPVIYVLYRAANGEVYNILVTWDEVKDLDI
jgi:hypothetical protein